MKVGSRLVISKCENMEVGKETGFSLRAGKASVGKTGRAGEPGR